MFRFLSSIALPLAILLQAGCRRAKPEAPAPAPAPTAESSPMPAANTLAPPVPVGVAPPATRPAPPVTYQVDANLQRELMKFYNDNSRPAMSWADLVGGKYIPAAPRGPDGQPLDWDSTMQRIGRASDRSRK